MDYKSVIILTLIMNAFHKINTLLSEVPSDTEVKINDSTYMNCSTSLLANQVQWRHGNNHVYTGIAILEPYNSRFSVEINASTGACNLVIRSIQPSDAGTYECADDEGTGDRRSVQLVVLDDDPVCKSNAHSVGVIGPNSCGIEAEEVKLSCSIEFRGNSLPVLEWKANGDNQSITDGQTNATSIKNEVTYTLTMKSSLGLNNSSFICQTMRTSEKHYSCSSDVINILYVFSSEVTVKMTMKDEVNCLANTTQSCSYKWKWFNGDDSSTESENQKLKPKKAGMHRCEATCSVRNKSCTVLSMHAMVYLEEATSGQSRMTLVVLLLVPTLAVVGVITVYWRKRKRNVERRRLDEIELQRREEEERKILHESHPGLIATIRTKAAEEGKRKIIGFAILDNNLFVVSEKCSEVEVHDLTNFSFSRQWNLTELIHPKDIASCHRNTCLYIHDGKYLNESNKIFRVRPNGELINKWSTEGEFGQLSVTRDSNVILVAFDKNKLNEYTPDGKSIRKIDLHLSLDESVWHPRHAIELKDGHFVVSHGFNSHDNDQHTVCIVDADGKPLQLFGGKRGSGKSHVRSPMYLSVDGNGFVMVADYHNSRILSLDSKLKFKGELLSKEHGLSLPCRICLDESCRPNRLFVADNEPTKERILIFDLGQLRKAMSVTRDCGNEI